MFRETKYVNSILLNYPNSCRYCLTVSDTHGTETILLDKNNYTFGSDRKNDFVDSDLTVSPFHAILIWGTENSEGDYSGYYLMDLSSTNGSQLDSKPVTAKYMYYLEDNSNFSLGFSSRYYTLNAHRPPINFGDFNMNEDEDLGYSGSKRSLDELISADDESEQDEPLPHISKRICTEDVQTSQISSRKRSLEDTSGNSEPLEQQRHGLLKRLKSIEETNIKPTSNDDAGAMEWDMN